MEHKELFKGYTSSTNEAPSEYINSLILNSEVGSINNLIRLQDNINIYLQYGAYLLIEQDSFKDRDLKEQIKLVYLAGDYPKNTLNIAITTDPVIVYEYLQQCYIGGEFECSVLWLWYVQYVSRVDIDTARSLAKLQCFDQKKSLVSNQEIQRYVNEVVRRESPKIYH